MSALDRFLLSFPREGVDRLAMGLTALAIVFVAALVAYLLFALARRAAAHSPALAPDGREAGDTDRRPRG